MAGHDDFTDALAGMTENARCVDGALHEGLPQAGLARALLALAYATRAQALATREAGGDVEVALSRLATAQDSLAQTAQFLTAAVEAIAASPRLK